MNNFIRKMRNFSMASYKDIQKAVEICGEDWWTVYGYLYYSACMQTDSGMTREEWLITKAKEFKTNKMKKKNAKTIYDGIRKETAPPTKTFRTRKGELDRKAKHKGRDDICKHPNKILGRSWAMIVVHHEYSCPDCGAEFTESDDY